MWCASNEDFRYVPSKTTLEQRYASSAKMIRETYNGKLPFVPSSWKIFRTPSTTPLYTVSPARCCDCNRVLTTSGDFISSADGLHRVNSPNGVVLHTGIHLSVSAPYQTSKTGTYRYAAEARLVSTDVHDLSIAPTHQASPQHRRPSKAPQNSRPFLSVPRGTRLSATDVSESGLRHYARRTFKCAYLENRSAPRLLE